MRKEMRKEKGLLLAHVIQEHLALLFQDTDSEGQQLFGLVCTHRFYRDWWWERGGREMEME